MTEKKKRIVIALGGNALGNTLHEQMLAVKTTAKAIVDLIQEGCEVIVAHGNGPQVGMINHAMAALSREDPNQPNTPLSVCVAMSQAYIGYDLQNALREEMYNGYIVKEDAGRGWRRVVASPLPQEIIEIGAIDTLVESGQLVIACGGGGIPVMRHGNHLKGASAVIDKDFASERLAEDLHADYLIILTAVEKVAIHFGQPDEQWLSEMTTDEARQYMAQNEFAPGSMLPKVQSAVKFAESRPGRTALITLLQKAKDGILGKTGTRIYRA